MGRPENPQVELLEVIGDWGFDPKFRGTQDALPVGHNICVLPDSKQTCPIIASHPLTVVDGKDQDYQVNESEPRIMGHTDDLTEAQLLVFSKYGVWSLVADEAIFPPEYLEEEDGTSRK